MIIVAVMAHCSLRQIDFSMAYTQAPMETDLYIKIHMGLRQQMTIQKTIKPEGCGTNIWQGGESFSLSMWMINTSNDQLSYFIKELTDISLKIED
ncbi:hypothetical protein ACHAW6_011287 [Cyclotella cf. meneghiniana]